MNLDNWLLLKKCRLPFNWKDVQRGMPPVCLHIYVYIYLYICIWMNICIVVLHLNVSKCICLFYLPLLERCTERHATGK
jgi:hypothetical protein